MSLVSYNKRVYRVDHFIREWRVSRGLTVDKLADLAGCSPSLISQLERGSCNYTQLTLTRLAEALACQPWQLLAAAPRDDDLVVWQDLAANRCWRDIPPRGHATLSMLLNNNAEAAIRTAKALFPEGSN